MVQDDSHAEPPSDEELVQRFQRGPASAEGRRAAEELFARYDERVYAWCRRMVHDHDFALDLAQEALLTALKDLGQFEGRSRFSSWLFTVVRRRSLRVIRRERLLLPAEADPDTLPAGGPDPAHVIANEDEERWLRGAMRELLEPAECTALILRCEEGLGVDDITRALGLTGASGARGVLQSARRKLRAALERRRAAELPR